MEDITNTETGEIKTKKNIGKIIRDIILFAIAISALTLFLNEERKSYVAVSDMLLKTQNSNSNCIHKRDSLIKEVNQLSIYKSLTKAMIHRDEAVDLLKYKVGDLAHSKIDSSSVIISDIIIGGSKYEYYIKYKIIYKDKTTEEVTPELIY